MRKSDFKKSAVIEIPSGNGLYAYAQVIVMELWYAPMLALLEGVFEKQLPTEKIVHRAWNIKKYVYVNPSSSRIPPSVWAWKVVSKQNNLLDGVVPPKALVHGDKLSNWTIVLPSGEKKYFSGSAHDLMYFENMGYASQTIWLSNCIEDFVFQGKELIFPNT